MNFKLNIAILLFCLSILIGTANATGSCFTGSYPAGATAAWPLTFTSPGGTTGTGFQIYVTLPVNVLTGNYLIANTATGAAPGPQWVEPANGLALYMNLGSNTIGTTGNTGYCLYSFPSASTQWGNGLGAAPQLSASYAQYDNGRVVFPLFYDNFAGSTLNTTIWNNGKPTTNFKSIHFIMNNKELNEEEIQNYILSDPNNEI